MNVVLVRVVALRWVARRLMGAGRGLGGVNALRSQGAMVIRALSPLGYDENVSCCTFIMVLIRSRVSLDVRKCFMVIN